MLIPILVEFIQRIPGRIFTGANSYQQPTIKWRLFIRSENSLGIPFILFSSIFPISENFNFSFNFLISFFMYIDVSLGLCKYWLHVIPGVRLVFELSIVYRTQIPFQIPLAASQRAYDVTYTSAAPPLLSLQYFCLPLTSPLKRFNISLIFQPLNPLLIQ